MSSLDQSSSIIIADGGDADALPTDAGVIPRAMAHVFEYLKASGKPSACL